MNPDVLNPDNVIDGHICLKKSQLQYIDKYKIGHNYKNRSEYIQYLVGRDIHSNRFDFIIDMMSMLLLPVMGFFFFLLLSVLTHGLLFYFFMCIFGLMSVLFSIAYYLRHRIKKD
jgi:hypothetical protein